MRLLLLQRLAAAACCCLLLSCPLTTAAAGGPRRSPRADGASNRKGSGARARGAPGLSPSASMRAPYSPAVAAPATAAASPGPQGAPRYLRQPSYKFLSGARVEAGESSDVSSSSSSRTTCSSSCRNSCSSSSRNSCSSSSSCSCCCACRQYEWSKTGEAGSDESTQDEQSGSEEAWSSMPVTVSLLRLLPSVSSVSSFVSPPPPPFLPLLLSPLRVPVSLLCLLPSVSSVSAISSFVPSSSCPLGLFPSLSCLLVSVSSVSSFVAPPSPALFPPAPFLIFPSVSRFVTPSPFVPSSLFVQTQDDEVLTEAESLCPPTRFLRAIGPHHSFNEPAELLEAFDRFAELNETRKSTKLLLFLNAGTGEELIVNRQISQRLVMRPTVRRRRSAFFSPCEGVAELSDEGRVQAEIKHLLLQKFVSLVRSSPVAKRGHSCVDAVLVSPLQSGVETALETLAGLLEPLSCSVPEALGSTAHVQTDNNYTRSNVRLLIAPQLREVIEAEGDVGEELPSVLKKTKTLRVSRGFQRDIFDCAVASYGVRWRRQQLGAAGGTPSPMEEELGLLHAPAVDAGEAQQAAAAAVLQLLDRFSDATEIAQSGRRALGLRTTFAFLKETANQDAATQRAVWAAPEELEPDACESEASITRRGVSLLRGLCAIKDTHKFLLVSHPKLVERITGLPVDNGELVGFVLDCQGLASCLSSAGIRPWESAAAAAVAGSSSSKAK
ncbi:hypothetical protein Esti_005833 [Eimeria stiedai]